MKNKIRLFVFAILYIFSFEFAAPALSQNIKFNKTLPPGESNLSFISGIAQDGNGVMWFSTKMGLYKYDGYNFEAYKNNPLTPNSVTSNNLETVFADSTGIIWIGNLGNGLDKFDPVTGEFTHYQHSPDESSSLSNDTVTAILSDNDGNLWIGTHGGLDLFEPQTNSFIHYRHDPDNPKSLSSNQVRVIYEDSKNRLWVGTGSPYPGDGGGPDSGGLNRMNKNNRTFTRFMHNPENPNSLLSNKISAIFEDNQGIIWIGTGNIGLHKMNENNATFERLIYNPEHPDRLSAPEASEGIPDYEHISFINQDINNNYWFGTVQNGIYFYNPDSGKVARYSGSENSDSGFDDAGGWISFTSRDGIFWIGGTQGGIYHTNPLHKNIPHVDLGNNSAQSFFEESDGTFWLGTSQVLYRYFKNEKTPREYVIKTKAEGISPNPVLSIYEDKKKNIWVGSRDGLSLWDSNKETSIHFTHDPEDNRSLSNNEVLEIYEDQKENFWVGTVNGLNLIDRETGLVKRYYPADSNDTSGGNLITSITEDNTGKIWVGAWNGGGIKLYLPEKDEFKTYLKGGYITFIHEDADNILWAAGRDGLYKYDRNNDVFINTRNLNQILDISEVRGMVEDDLKNLWLSTSKGIVKINSRRDEVSVYGENYGIDGNSFAYLSSYKGTDGKLYFGNSNGYYSFYPDEFTKSFNAPEIVFTGFHLANRLIKEGDEGPLEGHLSSLNEIRLQHNQNIFSFEFLAIDYASPEKNKTFYYLENYDNGWIQSFANQKAYYFGVPPGEYIFRVKAVNSYGIWTEKKIALTIMPPWWKKWWAYVLYGLVFIAGVFAFDRLMRRRIIQKERLRTQENELKQAKEIEKAYTELKATQNQLIQAEKMASLGELTAGIAHEIQNPLNFVNNFSEVNSELLDDLKEAVASNDQEEIEAIFSDLKENENKVTSHGKRAESIVKSMLLHSRGSSGKKEPTDINALCDEYLRLSYHGFRAKDKSFNAEFKLETDESLPTIDVVPQDIGRVLLNLINNAFYAVSKKAMENSESFKPEIIVMTKKVNKSIEIKVIDNGPGIPEKIKEKIFQPFFTTKSTGEGTGLGLSLSYDIVKAHGGELKVESKEGERTEFTILLAFKS